MTNHDRIRNMSAPKLAKIMLGDHCRCCAYRRGIECGAPNWIDCQKGVVEWLNTDFEEKESYFKKTWEGFKKVIRGR